MTFPPGKSIFDALKMKVQGGKSISRASKMTFLPGKSIFDASKMKIQGGKSISRASKMDFPPGNALFDLYRYFPVREHPFSCKRKDREGNPRDLLQRIE